MMGEVVVELVKTNFAYNKIIILIIKRQQSCHFDSRLKTNGFIKKDDKKIATLSLWHLLKQ
jgi:hypothetical protein